MVAGLDSIAASELSRILGEEFDIELPSTLTFDHPTIDAIANYIASIGVNEEVATEYAEVQLNHVSESKSFEARSTEDCHRMSNALPSP